MMGTSDPEDDRMYALEEEHDRRRARNYDQHPLDPANPAWEDEDDEPVTDEAVRAVDSQLGAPL